MGDYTYWGTISPWNNTNFSVVVFFVVLGVVAGVVGGVVAFVLFTVGPFVVVVVDVVVDVVVVVVLVVVVVVVVVLVVVVVVVVLVVDVERVVVFLHSLLLCATPSTNFMFLHVPGIKLSSSRTSAIQT